MLKMSYELLSENQKKEVDALIDECRNNKIGKSPKLYYLDLHTRGYLSKFPLNQEFVFDML